MKKILFLFMLLATLSATAQTITERSLTGTWKLTAAAMKGVYIDFDNIKVTVLKGYEDVYKPDDIKKIENGIRGEHPFPVQYTFISKGVLEVTAEGKTTRKEYELATEEGRTFINDGTDVFEVKFIDGRLHLVYADPLQDIDVEMIYKK